MSADLRIYLNSIGATPLLSADEEAAVFKRIQAGDTRARDKMIRSNLRLVAKIAHDYVNYGLPLDDLISEGNFGLMRAVDRFDPEKGGKLSTYAAWWIKQYIRRALSNQIRTVRLPAHLIGKLAKMRRIEESLGEELGRAPTTEELAAATGIDPRKLEFLKEASQRIVSLDAPLGDDDMGTTQGDLVPDERSPAPDSSLQQGDLQARLETMLGELDERERTIIQSRFGLGGTKRMTLAEVGAEFGLTRERIRQVQNIALAKLQRALARLEEPGLESLLTRSYGAILSGGSRQAQVGAR